MKTNNAMVLPRNFEELNQGQMMNTGGNNVVTYGYYFIKGMWWFCKKMNGKIIPIGKGTAASHR